MSSLVLMENAGRGAADWLCEMGVGGVVAVCCGPGANGGDGFVIARHLEAAGHAVQVLLFAEPTRIGGDAAHNLAVLQNSAIEILDFSDGGGSLAMEDVLRRAEWVVDALLGTGSRGDPRPPIATAIEAIHDVGSRVLAVDLPSGMDCDTGQVGLPTVRASYTATFVAGKPGFQHPEAGRHTGKVRVFPIGAPGCLLREAAAWTESG